jgi:predicted ferric reductase
MNLALWYASRATGVVSLLLLTAVVALGAIHRARAAAPRWPRFAVANVHRNLSLLAVLFLTVHVGTAVIDPYAGIGWVSVVVPFVGSYHPFWLGLGAIALDLVLALIASSLLRDRLGLRAWRAVHLSAYACWPVALVHGFGIGGADSRLSWLRLLDLICIATVAGAVGLRLYVRHPDAQARAVVEAGKR